jgi:signal transduction histidine kinase/DNA-binding response OmpR family regulator
VLVVDDTEAKRYLVVQTLRMSGMEVLEASTGREALAALARQPDVVVLDVRLPDMTGFEVCRRLKADPSTAALPVLYISTLLQDEELEAHLFEDGADGYIPQPIEPKHLVAQTWALVRMRRAELARQREREEAQAEQARLQRELEQERTLAEQRAAELLATTAAFSHALTPKDVAEALVVHGLKSLDAYAGVVSLVEGEHLQILSHFGYPPQLTLDHNLYPLSQGSPSTEAVRRGRPVEAQASDSFEREWPEFARTVQGSRSRSWLSTPLKEGEQVVGVLGLSFSTARRFTAQERAHLESLGQVCAQALARARLFEEERRAKEEARRREEMEQQFLGMVSHDLRNPLASISLGARTLQRQERPSPEVLLRVAGRIATSADTMGRMVSDLLDFTRGRLGGGIPLERTTNDLALLCREVIDEFSVTHASSDIRLEGDARCEGTWDGPRMRQVLSNLLSNALRHAREGTPVYVRARRVEGEVELAVTNEGEPIPEELLPVLFEPFRRGSSKFLPSGSLGLGLYIVRQVVEGHGGRVMVGSGEGVTSFTVRMPE